MSKEEICPKCGYQPLSSDECPQCGVDISNFVKLWREKEHGPMEPIKIAEKTGCKDDFFWLLKWIFRALLVLFIVGFAISQYFAWWIKHTHEMHSYTWDYLDSRQISLFISGDYSDETCCLEWLENLWELDEQELREMDEIFQAALPPERIRHLGFLYARSIPLQIEGKRPLVMCQTPIDSVRQEHGKPPGKNHVVLLENRGTYWLTPDAYAAIDKSKYVNLDTMIKKYEQTKSQLEF